MNNLWHISAFRISRFVIPSDFVFRDFFDIRHSTFVIQPWSFFGHGELNIGH